VLSTIISTFCSAIKFVQVRVARVLLVGETDKLQNCGKSVDSLCYNLDLVIGSIAAQLEGVRGPRERLARSSLTLEFN
jgi:hypothetical protein